jgi:hypothetical protein
MQSKYILQLYDYDINTIEGKLIKNLSNQNQNQGSE